MGHISAVRCVVVMLLVVSCFFTVQPTVLLSTSFPSDPPDDLPIAAPDLPFNTSAITAVSAHATISITASGCTPISLTVAAGSEVRWINLTSSTHVLISGEPQRLYLPLIIRNSGGSPSGPTPQPPTRGNPAPLTRSNGTPLFKVTLAPGQAFTYTFTSAGKYPYFLTTAPQYAGWVVVETHLPPDPATIAPPLDDTVATTLISATEFLYTGNDPIQTGVAPGTIDPRFVAVLRGRVLDRSGQPLSGVTVTILAHPEYGQTLSRADGLFDLAVNGGEQLVMNYHKDGYLPVQRHVQAPWQDYAALPDVVLIQRDSTVSVVDLTAPGMQAAQASVMTDADGARQVTVLFPPGTQAQIFQANGETQTITTLHVRATEFTVGERGPAAMPGELPLVTGYTYASEITVDEALAKIDGKDVVFNQPVFVYVDNFLDFPTGTIIPAGYYNADAGAWIPTDNGRTLKIISLSGGLAQLDTDGDAVIDNGVTLGITDLERGKLAQLFTAGKTLWRVPTQHFSFFDFNQGVGPDLSDPEAGPPKIAQQLIDFLKNPLCSIGLCHLFGSIVGGQNQTLGEAVSVAGTSFTLHYQSDRTRDFKAAYTLDVPVSMLTVPVSLKRIDVQLGVAGRTFTATLPALPNQIYRFEWDGLDAYGRRLQGAQPVDVRVGYVFDAYYQEPGPLVRAFGHGGNGVPISLDPARLEMTFWQKWRASIGAWDNRAAGLGGWSLSVHHAYDPVSRIFYGGDGSRQDITSFATSIQTVAGRYPSGFSGDGGAATDAMLYRPWDVGVARDGSFYIVDSWNNRIRRVSATGIITTVAGNSTGGYDGDEIPATQAGLKRPRGIALGPNGSYYIADSGNHRIRYVDPAGFIHTIAGTGTAGFSGDGGQATDAQLNTPSAVALGPDGHLYVADTNNHRIRQISPDGVIVTIAGTGTPGFSGDDGPAYNAQLNYPFGVEVGPAGVVYIADQNNYRVRRIGTNGIITTLAGGGSRNADGIPATQVSLDFVQALAVDAGGNVYFAHSSGSNAGRVRLVTPDGIMHSVAGGNSGLFCTNAAGLDIGDGGPAVNSRLCGPTGLGVLPSDGPAAKLYIADTQYERVRQIGLPLPAYEASPIFLPSADGTLLYQFDANGRHLRTFEALNHTALLTFTYNINGLLDTIVDANHNTTIIERTNALTPTAISAPFGQRTALTLDAHGYLRTVVDPLTHAYTFTYSSGGLMQTMIDPRGQQFTFNYNAQGRLITDQNPAGGSLDLHRIESGAAYTVTVDTAEGRHTRYAVGFLPTGQQTRSNLFPDGTRSHALIGTNYHTDITQTNQTQIASQLGPDPRFGLQAPRGVDQSIKTPGGLTYRVTGQRAVDDPLIVGVMTDTLTINTTRSFTSTYRASTRTWTIASPEGRTSTQTLDAQGRTIGRQIAGVQPWSITYDDRGRVTDYAQGTRHVVRAYDASSGYLQSSTDPLSHTTTYTRNAVGQVITLTQPDSAQWGMQWDANGNLITLTEPNRTTQHTFTYTPINQLGSYHTPLGAVEQFTYNKDRELVKRQYPSGQSIEWIYNAQDQLTTLHTPEGNHTYTYSPTTGLLSRATSRDGQSIDYAYDGGLITHLTLGGQVTDTVRYTYTNDLLVTQLSYAGATIPITYDRDGLPSRIGTFTLTRRSDNGLLTDLIDGEYHAAYSYTPYGELATMNVSHGASVYSATYSYDALGRITRTLETVGGATHAWDYAYDAVGQLVNVKRDNVSVEAYVYDRVGNRLAITNSLTGQTLLPNDYTYDADHKLLQAGATSYTYDADGRLSTITAGAMITTFHYNTDGTLARVDLPGAHQISYLYDAGGRRLARAYDGARTHAWSYGTGLLPLAEYNGSGALRTTFFYAGAGTPVKMTHSGQTYHIISDRLGSPRLILDASGVVIKRLDYDAYGNLLVDTNPAFDLPFGFAGGLSDPAHELIRFGARDYQPSTGRWTAKDPILFAGAWHLYAYVSNDPVNWADRLGLAVGGYDESGLRISDDASLKTDSAGVSGCLPPSAGAYLADGQTTGVVARRPLLPQNLLSFKFQTVPPPDGAPAAGGVGLQAAPLLIAKGRLSPQTEGSTSSEVTGVND